MVDGVPMNVAGHNWWPPEVVALGYHRSQPLGTDAAIMNPELRPITLVNALKNGWDTAPYYALFTC